MGHDLRCQGLLLVSGRHPSQAREMARSGGDKFGTRHLSTRPDVRAGHGPGRLLEGQSMPYPRDGADRHDRCGP